MCCGRYQHSEVGAPDSELFRRFEALVEQQHLKHWSVSEYAEVLSVTPTHLNRVTRAATGDTASHLILNRIVQEARRNLVYTNLPVSKIAYALGFDDPAYFSRVYAAATGLSPRAFRAHLHDGKTWRLLRSTAQRVSWQSSRNTHRKFQPMTDLIWVSACYPSPEAMRAHFARPWCDRSLRERRPAGFKQHRHIHTTTGAPDASASKAPNNILPIKLKAPSNRAQLVRLQNNCLLQRNRSWRVL
jgi:AraC-like DNA-binding protein